MKKGFRIPAQGSKKDQVAELKTQLANLEMAGRISQMMTQQLMNSVKTMSEDLGAIGNQLYEAQYQLGAVKKLMNLDAAQLNKIANEQRLVDFDEAATKQDIKENLVASEVVAEDSTVVITSTAADEAGNDRGIFRSRLKLSESGVPDLITGLAGKKAGDKVNVKLNGQDHTVELLAVRNPAAVQAMPEASH